MILEQCLMIWIGMSLALPFERSDIMLAISLESHADRNILEATEGLMYSVNLGSGLTGIPSSHSLSFTAIDVKKELKPFASVKRLHARLQMVPKLKL